MKKKVYICAPLPFTEDDMTQIKRYTAYALACGTAPVVPHFYILCQQTSKHKALDAIQAASKSLLWYCDEVWVFGEQITENMSEELKFCKTMNIRTRRIREKEIRKLLGGKCL